MNVVQRLRADNAELLVRLQAFADGIAGFRRHLDGDKFTGADLDGGRKDWIATADVQRWLDCIERDAADPVPAVAPSDQTAPSAA